MYYARPLLLAIDANCGKGAKRPQNSRSSTDEMKNCFQGQNHQLPTTSSVHGAYSCQFLISSFRDFMGTDTQTDKRRQKQYLLAA